MIKQNTIIERKGLAYKYNKISYVFIYYCGFYVHSWVKGVKSAFKDNLRFKRIIALCVCVCVCVYIYIYIYIYTHRYVATATKLCVRKYTVNIYPGPSWHCRTKHFINTSRLMNCPQAAWQQHDIQRPPRTTGHEVSLANINAQWIFNFAVLSLTQRH